MSFFKHEKALVHPQATVGEGTRIWAFVNIQQGAIIGEKCNICDGCYIEGGSEIGNHVTMKNGVEIFKGVTIGDDVFLGAHSTFINDRYPRSNRQDEWTLEETVVKKGATIGANATILCGVTIGEYAVVGAGSVVTKDIPAYAIVLGNPARVSGHACRCGRKLDKDLSCVCGLSYGMEENIMSSQNFSMMPKILVCPIAFNEHIKLRNVIERFLQSRIHDKVDYLIIDDGSDDGTTEMIAQYKERKVQTIKHAKRSGVGAAIRTAIDHGRQKGYEIIVIMAGNDKDNPEEIPYLLEPIIEEGFDVVQGSRYLGKVGSGGQMPFYRKLATRLHPWVFSLFTGRHLTDTTNGFRAIRLSLFDDQRINLNQEWLNTYELEPYILWKTITLGHQFKEVFVTKIYPPKKLGGYTKMIPLISWWSILRPLFYLRLGIKK